DTAALTMDTDVDVPNANLVLILCMYAEAVLATDHRAGVLTVPIPAVDLGSDETSGQVTALTSENRIDIRKVQLGAQTENRIEVRSGLHEGDFVVTGNR